MLNLASQKGTELDICMKLDENALNGKHPELKHNSRGGVKKLMDLVTAVSTFKIGP